MEIVSNYWTLLKKFGSLSENSLPHLVFRGGDGLDVIANRISVTEIFFRFNGYSKNVEVFSKTCFKINLS